MPSWHGFFKTPFKRVIIKGVIIERTIIVENCCIFRNVIITHSLFFSACCVSPEEEASRQIQQKHRLCVGLNSNLYHNVYFFDRISYLKYNRRTGIPLGHVLSDSNPWSSDSVQIVERENRSIAYPLNLLTQLRMNEEAANRLALIKQVNSTNLSESIH